MANISDRIKSLRLSADMTQEEFGKKFGIVKSTVSLYENGKSTPNDEIKKQICNHFNVSTDYLLGLTNDRCSVSKKENEKKSLQPENNSSFFFFDELLKDIFVSRLKKSLTEKELSADGFSETVSFDAEKCKAYLNGKCEPLVFTYGNKKCNLADDCGTAEKQVETMRKIRNGQDKYREKLLELCPYCPITKINDERLLIASHIKPWAASNEKEKVDPQNGFMFSPLYDKLFDRGFITFTEDKVMHVSNWISPKNCERMFLKDKTYVQQLPLTDERCRYLDFHITSVFHGIIE